ncbi:hypothetical protein [Kribbella sp. NPDC000426]|uniref:hypothetical protein n=1 Tax=Kribbella sp. NPDC000426 TaxID=3154255 RepID=UPI003317FD2A
MLRTWATRLDESWAEIAEISGDARTFDRLRINRIADGWDNGVYPFVYAACARRPGVREAFARDGLAYYDWRASESEQQRLTPEVGAELAGRFDLRGAEVSELTIERSRGRLECRMSVVVERTEVSYALPDIYLYCSGVEALQFDAADRRGIAISWRDGVPLLSIGSDGSVRAREVALSVQRKDWTWSASELPPDPRGSKRVGRSLSGAALEAASLLRAATLLTRSVWALGMTHVVPVRAFGRMFAGAGTAILAAGSAVRREAAFRRLIERWRTAGGPELAPWFAAPMGYLPPEPPELPAGHADGSELLLAGFRVSADDRRTATLLYAEPGSPWLLRRVAGEDPARFTVDGAAFGCRRADAERNGLVRLEP